MFCASKLETSERGVGSSQCLVSEKRTSKFEPPSKRRAREAAKRDRSVYPYKLKRNLADFFKASEREKERDASSFTQSRFPSVTVPVVQRYDKSLAYPSLAALRKDLYLDRVTLPVIEESFKQWVGSTQYLIFEKQAFCTSKFETAKRLIACKAAKRGNSVYAYKLKRNLADFLKPFEKEKEQKPVIWQGKTNVLFITDTFDTKLCDFKTAWYIIGSEFNRQIANLRQKYGRIHVARTGESFENGYPHLHFAAIFLDHEFEVELKYSAKEKKRIYRVLDFERDRIASSWFSYVDIRGMVDVAEGLKYLFKYVTKASDLSKDDLSGKGLRTQALMWANRKRAYSLGVKFKQSIFEKYLSLDLIVSSVTQRVSEQMTLEQVPVRDTLPYFLKISFESYSLKGVIAKTRLKIAGSIPIDDWSFGLTQAQAEYVNWLFIGIKPDCVRRFTRSNCKEQQPDLKNSFKGIHWKEIDKPKPVKFPAKVGSNYPGYGDCVVYVNCNPPAFAKVSYKKRSKR